MTKIIQMLGTRVIPGLLLACALLITGTAYTASPTPEQLKMLEQLTPEQRAAALKALGGGSGSTIKQEQVTQPEVVRRKSPVTDSQISEQIQESLNLPEHATKKDEKTIHQRLKQFGYDLFAGTPTTFAPATDIPVPVNYIIGPGDTVEVQLFGKDNEQYSLVVTREGILNFPGIGPVTVAGLTYSELKQTLEQRIKEQMIGVKVSITMGSLRSIRIFILGDAEQPGSYTVSSLASMTNALFVSGGIKPIGSLRNIQLKRNGKIVKRLDLYDLLLQGDTSDDARLLPGDVIYIPSIGRTVGVGGEVRRPAIYELNGEKTVAELIAMAGGLLPTAYPQATQLERINSKRERTLVDINLTHPAGKNTKLQEGDVIRVYSVLEKMEDIVLLSGHVDRTGAQQWRKGMRLTDLISSAGNLLPQADMNYVLIRREKVDGTIDIFSTDLAKAFKARGKDHDILLQARDEVNVFSFKEDRSVKIKPLLEELALQAGQGNPARKVSIGGLVRAPGSFPLEDGMRISDLIRAAGQLQEAAYTLGAELTRYGVVNSEYRQAQHIPIDLAAVLDGNSPADILLQSHDYIHIKNVPRWNEQESMEIRGEVKFPGVYPAQRGETLSSIIRRAGGITDIAFIEGSVFMREELREKEQEQMDRLADRLESDLLASSLEQSQSTEDADTQQSLALGRSLVQQLRSTKAAGRLVIDLEKVLQSNVNVINNKKSDEQYIGDASGDLAVQNGDKLYIPRKKQSVTVLGEVQYPTSHIYDPSLDRDAYVNRSGGNTYKADNKRTYVVRANGEVVASSSSFWNIDDSEMEIRPGDTIVVPLDAERIKPLALWTNVTQILYQVGVAVAAFNSAGIF